MEEHTTAPNTSSAESPDAEEHFKTLGVRVSETKHAKLRFIAQLGDTTITDEIRRAIDDRIEAAQADPELMARADALRSELEREAEARRVAIAGFFGQQALSDEPGASTAKPPRRASSREARA